ncbi:MAG: zinc-ribbon domain-containing protein [Clostridia bacterium]|nr:zinc-ribbon domain-containing protein [Clostridia bacterium]
MSFCIKCGTQLNDGDAFCVSCGNPVVEEKQALQIQPQTQSQPTLCGDTTPVVPGRGSSVAGMILGIISSLYGLVFSMIVIRTLIRLNQYGWYDWYEQAEASDNVVLIMFFSVLPVLAIVFSVIGRSKGDKTGISKSGLITGIIGLVLFVFALILDIFI